VLAREAAVATGEGDPGEAAERTIARFETEAGEHVGVIVVDINGVVGSAHGSTSTQTARASGADAQ